MNTQTNKPKAKVIGQDGNVFVTMAICERALKQANMLDEAEEMTSRVFESKSYEEALIIMREYCQLC